FVGKKVGAFLSPRRASLHLHYTIFNIYNQCKPLSLKSSYELKVICCFALALLSKPRGISRVSHLQLITFSAEPLESPGYINSSPSTSNGSSTPLSCPSASWCASLV